LSVARLHHYVPRCYLKGFTREKTKGAKLFVVDFVGGKSYWTSPRNVGAQTDFNRVEIPGQPPDALERALSKFDSELGIALATIGRERTLEDADAKLVLLNFASVVAARNPESRARMEEALTRVYEGIADLVTATPNRFQAEMQKVRTARPDDPVPDVPYEEVREFVRNRAFEVVFPPGYHISHEFAGQDAVLRTMLDRRWALLRAPHGAEFVTNDRPACLLPNAPTRQPLGFGMRSTTVLLPVTSALLALGTFDGPEGTIDVRREHVALLNQSLALRSTRCVFARSDDFEITIGSNTIRGRELINHARMSERASAAPKTT
jgi:hypothetical protein